jgi:excisionase family DNA binding protein
MEELLTIEQVAERLQVNTETVRRWLLSGKLKGTKIGGSLWRIQEVDLREFVGNKG